MFFSLFIEGYSLAEAKMCAFSEFFIAYIFKMVYSDWFLKVAQ